MNKMDKWKERAAIAIAVLVLLIPIAFLQARIDEDEDKVVFLRWADNQEAYSEQLLQRIIAENDERDPAETALFEQVMETGNDLSPDFTELTIPEKWQLINHHEFDPLYQRFLELARQSKLSLLEGEIEWANPEVSANVGALVLGFRKLVADMLWLKVDEYWHRGLVQRMLPMMETVTTLDPHFIEAYALGAWHLAYNVTVLFHTAEERQKYIDQGIGLLKKGIKNNPRSSKLYSEMGFTMYFRKLGDWEKAAYYLGEATKYEHEAWVERAYALSLERLQQEEKALALLQDYDRRHPTFIMQKLTMARLEKKLKARELEREGDLEGAFKIWQFLRDDDPSDVIAPRETLRLKAALKKFTDYSSDFSS
jgi:tetratricopeptide (TPR) repeat protein